MWLQLFAPYTPAKPPKTRIPSKVLQMKQTTIVKSLVLVLSGIAMSLPIEVKCHPKSSYEVSSPLPSTPTESQVQSVKAVVKPAESSKAYKNTKYSSEPTDSQVQSAENESLPVKDSSKYSAPKKEVHHQSKHSETLPVSSQVQDTKKAKTSAYTKTVLASLTPKNGDITHFDDEQYQCYEWNNRAKSAMAQGYLFAAGNYKLLQPQKGKARFTLTCGGPQYMCARCPESGREYIFIDWCDPNGAEECTTHGEAAIDILVGSEKDNVECSSDCSPYSNFVKLKTWDLVECSFQINAKDFEVGKYRGDGSEYGRKTTY